MSSAAAERELHDLRLRFGQTATGLAAHAAIPVAVTPTLLNLIRTTFFLDPPEALPYDIEAELLLSPAFRGIGTDLYEMDAGLRDLLLAELDVVYGPGRARQVAELLYSYSVEAAPWAHSPRLDAAQQLTAYSFIDPDGAREALEQSATAGTGSELDRTWQIAMEQRLERAADAAPSRFLDRAVEHARHDRWSGFVAEVDGAVERFPLDRTTAAAARALLRFGSQLPETRDSYLQYVMDRLLELVELVERQSPVYRYQLESLLSEATEQGRSVQEQWQALQRIEPLLERLGAPGEMPVALELLHLYRDARAADPNLYFLVQTCVDWVRCGLTRPIPERDLLDLTHDAIEENLPHIDLTDDEMHEALRRARSPIARAGQVALLRTIRLAGQSRGYEVLDYLVAADDGQGARPRPVADSTWRRFLDRATDNEALYIGVAADQRNNVPVAVSATRRAAEAGNAEAQYALGVLLAERLDPPDLDGARTWFTRAAEAGAAEPAAAAMSRVLGKVESSLTGLELLASASWTPVQLNLRTTELWSDLNALENHLRRLPDLSDLSGNTRQAILLKAEGKKVEQSSRNIKTRLDNLQDRSLPAEKRAREFDAYVTASENLRSAIGRLQEILLTLEEAAGQGADAVAQERAEPDYVLEDQPWYAPSPPEIREIERKEAETLRARIDVVLITVTEVELLAVLKPLRPPPGRRKVLMAYWDEETYYLGRFGEYLVAVTKCRMGALGEGSVTLATTQAQEVWFPRAVIMIGIAFGKDRTKQRVADVIVASQVISYEPQRVGAEIVARGPILPTNSLLLNRFENAAGWWFERPDKSRCRLIVGPVLSGEKLIDDPDFKKDPFKRYRSAVGGDIEGAGLYAAAARGGTAWILVKGISGWADGRKDSRRQPHPAPLAAAAATSLVLHILSRRTALQDIEKPARPAG